MNLSIIYTLLTKDLTLFFRNRFFAVVTALSLVFFTGIYLVLPASVDAEIRLALYSPEGIPAVFLEAFENQKITIDTVDSEEALKKAVEEGDYPGGIVLDGAILDQIAAGEETQVVVYFSANAPQELNDAVTVLVRMVFNEIANQFHEQPLNVRVSVEVLGYDFQGKSIPIRKRMLPLLAVFMLITETLGLATLFAEERARGTLRALLVTPVRLRDLFISKGLMGVGLAFIQVLILMLVSGALSSHPFLIIVTLLIGAFMVTGLGFLLASTGKDMMSIMGWAMLVYIVLSVPSFGIMFPGTSAEWVKLIPSYYLVDTVHQIINYDAGWGDVMSNLLILLVYSIAIMGVGTMALKRRLS